MLESVNINELRKKIQEYCKNKLDGTHRLPDYVINGIEYYRTDDEPALLGLWFYLEKNEATIKFCAPKWESPKWKS